MRQNTFGGRARPPGPPQPRSRNNGPTSKGGGEGGGEGSRGEVSGRKGREGPLPLNRAAGYLGGINE